MMGFSTPIKRRIVDCNGGVKLEPENVKGKKGKKNGGNKNIPAIVVSEAEPGL